MKTIYLVNDNNKIEEIDFIAKYPAGINAKEI